jgi:hypothetical protein
MYGVFGVNQRPPQAFIFSAQAFVLNRDPRQLFRETLDSSTTAIIARTTLRIGSQECWCERVLRASGLGGRLFPEFLRRDFKRATHRID